MTDFLNGRCTLKTRSTSTHQDAFKWQLLQQLSGSYDSLFMTEMQYPSTVRKTDEKNYLAAFIRRLPVLTSLKKTEKIRRTKWQKIPGTVRRLTFYCITFKNVQL